MHHPDVAWCRLKGLRIKIHLNFSIYLEEFVWGQLALSLNNIADGISSFPCSFDHPLRLSLANLIGEFYELLPDRLDVKPLHFLAIQDGLTRDGLVVDGGLRLVRTYDPTAPPFVLMERSHSSQKRCHSRDLLTHPSEQVSGRASFYPCEVWKH